MDKNKKQSLSKNTASVSEKFTFDDWVNEKIPVPPNCENIPEGRWPFFWTKNKDGLSDEEYSKMSYPYVIPDSLSRLPDEEYRKIRKEQKRAEKSFFLSN